MRTYEVSICQLHDAPLHQPRPDGKGCTCNPEDTMMARRVRVLELPKTTSNDNALVILVPPTDDEIESEELRPDDYVLQYGPDCDVHITTHSTGTHQITIKRGKR